MAEKKRRYVGPYNTVEPLHRAIKIAHWMSSRAMQSYLVEPSPLDEEQVTPGEALFVSRVILALPRDELLALYDEMMRAHQDCLADGVDFTTKDVRAVVPHQYPPPSRADG